MIKFFVEIFFLILVKKKLNVRNYFWKYFFIEKKNIIAADAERLAFKIECFF